MRNYNEIEKIFKAMNLETQEERARFSFDFSHPIHSYEQPYPDYYTDLNLKENHNAKLEPNT